ncbi:MAG: hypothetical protein KC441_00885 [Anaerolineales bacterium]|nr:hypothetical protein [Anaerolineales bacterium]
MFEKVRDCAKKKMTGEQIVVAAAGVTAVLVTFVLEDDGKAAYGCRMFKGDLHNGPYHSVVTDLYLDQNGALCETVGVARSLGVNAAVWLEVIGPFLTT